MDSFIDENDVLHIDLSKVLTDASQVEVGKEYYVFESITSGSTVLYFSKLNITGVTDDPEHPFEADGTAYSYAYPVPEEKMRPMTFEEIRDYWKEHRTEIYSYDKEYSDECCVEECFMITGFETHYIYFNDGFMEYNTFVKHVIREDGTRFEIIEED